MASIQQARLAAIMNQNRERLALVASRTQLRLSLDRFNRTGDEAAQQRMVRILNDAASSLPDLRIITVYDLQGVAVASTEPALLGTAHFDPVLLRRSLEGAVVDRMFPDEAGQERVHLCGPLLLEGRTIGVMVIRSDVDNLLLSLGDFTGLGETGESLLIRPVDGADRRENGWQFLAPTRFDPAAALTPCHWGEPGVIARLTEAEDTSGLGETRDYRQMPVEAVAHRVPETDWVVLVKMDRDEIHAGLRRTAAWGLILSLVLALMVAMVAVWLARGLSSPLADLARAAGDYAAGDFSRRVAAGGRDELGLLARGFNAMGGEIALTQKRLREKIQDLEEEIVRRHGVEKEREALIEDLRQAMSEIKTLEGVIPICARCKKIRDDQGYWNKLETYLHEHSDARFSHGICPDCFAAAEKELEILRDQE